MLEMVGSGELVSNRDIPLQNFFNRLNVAHLALTSFLGHPLLRVCPLSYSVAFLITQYYFMWKNPHNIVHDIFCLRNA